jgi:hypothetical protein
MISNFDCAINFAKGQGQKRANKAQWEFIDNSNDRVFYSYATPIAYILNGLMIIDEKHYSRTTSEHQSCLLHSADTYGYKRILTEHPKDAYMGMKAKGSFNKYHSKVVADYLSWMDFYLDKAFQDDIHHNTKYKFIRKANETERKLRNYVDNIVIRSNDFLENKLVYNQKKQFQRIQWKKDKAISYKPSKRKNSSLK